MANGVVYVGLRRQPVCAERQHRRQAVELSPERGGASPAVANGVVYIGCSDGNCMR